MVTKRRLTWWPRWWQKGGVYTVQQAMIRAAAVAVVVGFMVYGIQILKGVWGW